MCITLQTDNIQLYTDYTYTTTNSSLGFEDDIFTNNDDESFISLSSYYSNDFSYSSGLSWGSVNTLVSQSSLLFTDSFSDAGDFSDYFLNL